MGAMSELDAAGATYVLELDELVARHPFNSAPDAFPWRVAAYRRDRGLWRLREDTYGVYVDAHPAEVIRLGRPDALATAASIGELHTWDRDELRTFLEHPAGHTCAGCGRPTLQDTPGAE